MIEPIPDVPDVPEPTIPPLPAMLQVGVDQTSDGLPVVTVSAFQGGIIAGVRLSLELALLVAKHLTNAVGRVVPSFPPLSVPPLPVTVQVSVDQTSEGLPVVKLSASVGGVIAALRLSPDLALLVSRHLTDAVERIVLCSGPHQGSA